MRKGWNEFKDSPNAVGIIGDPVPTEAYSVEQLKEMGYVGVYVELSEEEVERIRKVLGKNGRN